MSFSEDCVRFGDRLAKLVDAGVPVKEAARSLGISRQRCYAILRATGRPVGLAAPEPRVVLMQAQVAAVFTATGSINQAAKAGGISHSSARRAAGGSGLGQSGSPARAARRRPGRGSLSCSTRAGPRRARPARSGSMCAPPGIGVDGVRKVGNTRVHPDGTVIDYTTGTRYTQPVKIRPSRPPMPQCPRSVGGICRCRTGSLIADGLISRADADADRRRDRQAHLDGVARGPRTQHRRAVSAVSGR